MSVTHDSNLNSNYLVIGIEQKLGVKMNSPVKKSNEAQLMRGSPLLIMAIVIILGAIIS